MNYQDFDAKIEIKSLSIEWSLTAAMLSFEIVIGELKPGAAEVIQLEERDISKVSAFSEVSDYGDGDARHKTTSF